MSNNAFSLVVKIAGEDPVKHNLEADTITIGRGPDNMIQVLVAEVSVKHGELVKAGDSYKIADGGSSNGTTVNGTPIDSDGVGLTPMDKVLLGATTPAYFVPRAIADSGSLEELIAGIEAAPKGNPQTAPVAIAAAVSPAAPGKPAPLKPVAVKPVAVKPGAPAPAAPAAPGKPAPLQPAAVKPAAVAPSPVAGASTVKLEQVQAPKPGGPVAPKVGGPPAPAAMRPPGAAPVAPGAPKAPGGPPAPAAPGPPKPGGPPAPAALKPPGGAPAPVPLKKIEPKAPSIPLPPKKP